MKPLLYPLLFAALTSACGAGPSKAELDTEVRRLCAIDGGVKIYETVELPPEMFNEWGQVRVPDKSRTTLDDPYFYEWSVTALKPGNPGLSRSHFSLYRTSDGRLLGESIAYIRRGGDMPGPWEPSSFTCPSDSGLIPLSSRVFTSYEGAAK